MTSDDLGKFVLRASLSIFMLLHGIGKMTGGIAPIVGLVEKSGLPGWFAYLVFVGEVLAPLLALVGLWTRPAALVMFVNMVVAIALAHPGDLLKLTKTGAWALELQGFFLFTALAVALLGAGRISLAGSRGRWN